MNKFYQKITKASLQVSGAVLVSVGSYSAHKNFPEHIQTMPNSFGNPIKVLQEAADHAADSPMGLGATQAGLGLLLLREGRRRD